MKATDLLKKDHRVVDAMFQAAESETPVKQAEIYKKIYNELSAHAHVEETIFYPRLRRDGNKDLVDITLEGIEEHGQIRKFLEELKGMSGKKETFAPKLKVLIEDVRHHVKEEEGEMFDLVEDQFSDEVLKKLGREMQLEKERFQNANGMPLRTPEDSAAGDGLLSRMVDSVTGIFSSGKTSGSKTKAGSSGGKKSTASGRKSSKASSGASKKTSSSGRSNGKSAKASSGSGTNGGSKTKSGSSAKAASSSSSSKTRKSSSSKSASK